MKNLRFIFRMFLRNPLLLFVNLPGLAIGLSAVLLLSVYLKYELSYDQHFPTRNNVLRLYNAVEENGQSSNYGICLRTAYTEIPQNIPEIEAATQLYRGWFVLAERETKKFENLGLLYADKGFFDVFGLDLIHGNSTNALEGDKQVVINASTAQKIFNRLDCVGEVLNISEEPFVVTGVMNDLPKNTHFQFDLLASMQTLRPERWQGLELYTYFKINPNTDINSAGKKIADANTNLMKPWEEQLSVKVESGTELLSRLHFYSVVDFDISPKANLGQIYIIAGIAFFILLIAMVNYINIYVLHGEKRIAEIAARKSLGANQKNLSRLFYTETGIIGLSALAIALLLSGTILPFFAELMQRQMDMSELFSFSGLVIVALILLVIVGISGAYPSYYLSRFDLVNALKGKSNKIRRKSHLSRIAVITQFTVTVFLICSLIVVYAQINFLKDIPLGFKAENVTRFSNLNSKLRQSYRSLESELSQFPFIESTGTSNHSMGGGCSGQGIKKYGDPGNYQGINEYRVNPGFCKTMKLELLDGRYFTSSEADKNAVILNQAAVKLLGLKTGAGEQVQMSEDPLNVIAVVKDFYYTDHPGEPIAPLVISQQRNNYLNSFYVRTYDELTNAQLAQIEAVFKSYSPDYIMSHSQLTDVYANKYKNEERVMKLVSSGAILAILISLIGLTALSVLNVNRRKKEIGIRKVIGSTETQVVKALLGETFVLVTISIAIAFILSYIALQHWLINYAKHVSLSPVYFLIAGILAFIIAFIAVAWQSWSAATRNPVEALRYE